MTLWDDTMITTGDKWRQIISRALEETKEGVVIVPIQVSASRFHKTQSLAQFQSVNSPSQPLNAVKKSKQEEVFVQVSEIVEQAFRA